MKNARLQKSETSASDKRHPTPVFDLLPESPSAARLHSPPIVTGQVLHLIREHQPILSLVLTADYAISETAARVHNLWSMGWNIQTAVHATVIFRGVERHNGASYSSGVPEWPAPGFNAGG